jgi:hypothetical protein
VHLSCFDGIHDMLTVIVKIWAGDVSIKEGLAREECE